MQHIFKVSEISLGIKNLLQANFSNIKVMGEIIEQPKAMKHMYFSLKEGDQVLSCVIWSSSIPRLKFRPEQGVQVVCTGQISSFPQTSKYQLIVSDVERHSLGELIRKIEELKKKLREEGLFERENKPQLPKFPRKLGIATSMGGAVIHDMLNRLRDRYPCEILVYPIAVQGQTCPQEAIEALLYLGDRTDIDVIILARGGGSFEDLIGFNNEALVRTVAASKIPVITAIGHETDTTLVDFASTLRASTPTAAIELCTPNRKALLENIYQFDPNSAFARHLENLKLRMLRYEGEKSERFLDNLQQKLDFLDINVSSSLDRYFYRQIPEVFVPKTDSSRIEAVFSSIEAKANSIFAILELELQRVSELTEAVSYKKTLERGFCIAVTGKKAVRSAKEAQKAKQFDLGFSDGIVEVQVKKNSMKE